MTSRDDIKAAIDNVDEQLKKKGDKLPSNWPKLMEDGYSPELNNSEELNAEEMTTFQEMIGC